MTPTTAAPYYPADSDKATFSHCLRATYDFGVCDKKGRTVGAVCHFRTVDVKADRYLWDREAREYVKPGRYFVAEFEAARGGAQFGAIQPTRVFKTTTARNVALFDYLAAAKKRAIKQFPA